MDLSTPVSVDSTMTDSPGASGLGPGKNNNIPRPPPAGSPTKCAICLGDLQNPCYTNTCVHQFCFPCLHQWSKVKAECPLCKSNFQTIYHNIRSDNKFDEYRVPLMTGISNLSIRDHFGTFSFEGFPHPFPAHTHMHIVHNQPATAHRGFGAAYHDHGYSFHRLLREGRQAGSSSLRIYPHSHITRASAAPPPSVPPGFDAQDNPFDENEHETFGSYEENHRRANRIQGYQARRRIYDRNQFVEPFSRSLPPGTVFFPSVEYFQSHPLAFRRVRDWLYREIMVLCSLNRSRSEMGICYEIIVGLLLRYDIRSREFRQLVQSYFQSRTRHFQHEFYHFILSGMNIEEYDRNATYSSHQPDPRLARTQHSSTSTASNARSEPEVVTIMSDSEDEDDVTVLVDDDSCPSSSIPASTSRSPSSNQQVASSSNFPTTTTTAISTPQHSPLSPTYSRSRARSQEQDILSPSPTFSIPWSPVSNTSTFSAPGTSPPIASGYITAPISPIYTRSRDRSHTSEVPPPSSAGRPSFSLTSIYTLRGPIDVEIDDDVDSIHLVRPRDSSNHNNQTTTDSSMPSSRTSCTNAASTTSNTTNYHRVPPPPPSFHPTYSTRDRHFMRNIPSPTFGSLQSLNVWDERLSTSYTPPPLHFHSSHADPVTNGDYLRRQLHTSGNVWNPAEANSSGPVIIDSRPTLSPRRPHRSTISPPLAMIEDYAPSSTSFMARSFNNLPRPQPTLRLARTNPYTSTPSVEYPPNTYHQTPRDFSLFAGSRLAYRAPRPRSPQYTEIDFLPASASLMIRELRNSDRSLEDSGLARRTPPASPSPRQLAGHCPIELAGTVAASTAPAMDETSDSDIEMLGTFPVIKPPPLATITISDEDEEGHVKVERQKKSPSVEVEMEDEFLAWATNRTRMHPGTPNSGDQQPTTSRALSSQLMENSRKRVHSKADRTSGTKKPDAPKRKRKKYSSSQKPKSKRKAPPRKVYTIESDSSNSDGCLDLSLQMVLSDSSSSCTSDSSSSSRHSFAGYSTSTDSSDSDTDTEYQPAAAILRKKRAIVKPKTADTAAPSRNARSKKKTVPVKKKKKSPEFVPTSCSSSSSDVDQNGDDCENGASRLLDLSKK